MLFAIERSSCAVAFVQTSKYIQYHHLRHIIKDKQMNEVHRFEFNLGAQTSWKWDKVIIMYGTYHLHEHLSVQEQHLQQSLHALASTTTSFFEDEE